MLTFEAEGQEPTRSAKPIRDIRSALDAVLQWIGSEDAKIDEWPRREGFLERLVAMIVGDTAALADVALAWAEGAGLDLTSVRALVDVMATSPVLAALPYVLEIR